MLESGSVGELQDHKVLVQTGPDAITDGLHARGSYRTAPLFMRMHAGDVAGLHLPTLPSKLQWALQRCGSITGLHDAVLQAHLYQGFHFI